MSHDDTPSAGDDEPVLAQRQYDPGAGGELATEVILAVAEAAGVDPAEIRTPPLYECIDTEAVESVFFTPGTRTGQATGFVEFSYDDHPVRISSDGWIEVFDTGANTGEESSSSPSS